MFIAYGTSDKASDRSTCRGTMADPMAPIRAVVRLADATRCAFDGYETRGGREAKSMQIDYSK